MQEKSAKPENPKSPEEQDFSKTLAGKLIQALKQILKTETALNQTPVQAAQSLLKAVKDVKTQLEKISREHAIYKAFVEKALEANIEHIDDAYRLAKFDDVQISKNGEVQGIGDAIDKLKTESPHLFRQHQQFAEIPSEFNLISSDDIVLKQLRNKAKESGALEDLQEYWAQRKKLKPHF